MTTEEEQSLNNHRLCVLSTLLHNDAPPLTPVSYIYEGGKS